MTTASELLKSRRLFAGLLGAALAVASTGCGSSGGSTSPSPGSLSGGASTSAPTIVPSNPATVAPTTAATAVPTVAATATPPSTVLGTVGTTSCTAADNAVPGAYADVNVRGSVSGHTFTESSGEGQFGATAFADGATPGPTIAPVVIPTPGPVAANNALFIVYYGEYTVSVLTGLTSGVTDGCFVLVSTEPLGSTVGQLRGAGSASPTPAPVLSIGEGTAAFQQPYPSPTGPTTTGVVSGFAINNLTRTTGSGTFTLATLANASSPIGSGTVTITGSTAVFGQAQLASGSQTAERFPAHSNP